MRQLTGAQADGRTSAIHHRRMGFLRRKLQGRQRRTYTPRGHRNADRARLLTAGRRKRAYSYRPMLGQRLYRHHAREKAGLQRGMVRREVGSGYVFPQGERRAAEQRLQTAAGRRYGREPARKAAPRRPYYQQSAVHQRRGHEKTAKRGNF